MAAAEALFVDNGYAATSITVVAHHAGVSAESVYVIFGSKRDLLRAVMEAAAAGSREAVVTDDWLDAVRAEPDQRRRLDLMGDATRQTLRHVAPLDEVVPRLRPRIPRSQHSSVNKTRNVSAPCDSWSNSSPKQAICECRYETPPS